MPQHAGKGLVGCLVPEGVLQLHRVVEGGLRFRRAGDGEMDLTKLCGQAAGMRMIVVLHLVLGKADRRRERDPPSRANRIRRVRAMALFPPGARAARPI